MPSLHKLTAETVTNLYLYGQINAPSPKALISDSWIRPTKIQTTVDIDKAEYMQSGAGRFALASKSPLIESFFQNNIPTAPAGKQYTQSEISALTGVQTDAFVVKQRNQQDGIDDHAERTYIYSATGFQISGNPTFVVRADGSKYIQNLAIEPIAGTEQFNNPISDGSVDPFKIGRPVNIEFSGNSPTISTYTQQDYKTDKQLESQNFTTPDSHAFGQNMGTLFSSLQRSGTTSYLDHKGRVVIYGTNGDDRINNQTLAKILPPHLINTANTSGVTIIAGDGRDVIDGTRNNDLLLGGRGNDSLDGRYGNDVLKDKSGCDLLFGLHGKNTLDAGNKNDFIFSNSRSVVKPGDGSDLVYTKIVQGEPDTGVTIFASKGVDQYGFEGFPKVDLVGFNDTQMTTVYRSQSFRKFEIDEDNAYRVLDPNRAEFYQEHEYSDARKTCPPSPTSSLDHGDIKSQLAAIGKNLKSGDISHKDDDIAANIDSLPNKPKVEQQINS